MVSTQAKTRERQSKTKQKSNTKSTNNYIKAQLLYFWEIRIGSSQHPDCQARPLNNRRRTCDVSSFFGIVIVTPSSTLNQTRWWIPKMDFWIRSIGSGSGIVCEYRSECAILLEIHLDPRSTCRFPRGIHWDPSFTTCSLPRLHWDHRSIIHVYFLQRYSGVLITKLILPEAQ